VFEDLTDITGINSLTEQVSSPGNRGGVIREDLEDAMLIL
ncbi:uncharacterized protein METZ01_LOCUS498926, partial [marine metagenome]